MDIDSKRKISQFSLFFVFFVINIIYVIFDLPKYLYPGTAFFFFLFIIVASWRRSKIETEKAIEKIELTLTETVPQKRLQNELDMAKRVQEGLLSVESPEIPGFKIAKKCIPAESVGGDFYTFISKDFVSLTPKAKSTGVVEYFDQQDTYLGIVTGDVAGHGVSSALIMALTSGLLSEIGKQDHSPSKTLAQANKDLLKYIENSQITHVTVFYGVLNTSSMKFTFSRAGHPPAMLIRKDNTMEELDVEGVFLGMFEVEEFAEKEIQLHSGDRIYFYTDGITETKNTKGEMYGIERFKEFILKYQDKPIGNAINQIFDELDRFSNYQKAKDDRSLVILEVD